MLDKGKLREAEESDSEQIDSTDQVVLTTILLALITTSQSQQLALFLSVYTCLERIVCYLPIAN